MSSSGPGEVDATGLVGASRLGERLADVTGEPAWRELSAELISGGKSNLTFVLSCAAGELVLRRPPTGELLPSAHDMGREARVQSALAPTAVPVPGIVLAEESPDVMGAPFYVMERVAGHVIRDEVPAELGGATGAGERLAGALADVLGDLHAVNPVAVGLRDYGRPDGYLERQVRRWAGQWERSRFEPVAEVEELERRLAARVPGSSGASVVHGDYRLDNCVIAPGDPSRVAAVLDWELSTLGDPLADLGLFLFYWRQPGEQHPSIIPAITAQEGFPSREWIAGRYAARTGRDVSDLAFHLGLAHYKFAVIVQGIAARVRAGSMAGQDFGDLSEEVRFTAEQGLAALT
ncbi:phosphotransferase family protein [Actinomycetota bacterium]